MIMIHVIKRSFIQRWKCSKRYTFYAILRRYKNMLKKTKNAICSNRKSVNTIRKYRAKLGHAPGSKLQGIAHKVARNSSAELIRMRRKGNNWDAHDLSRFQAESQDAYNPIEYKAICEEWLQRLNSVPKKYSYLAWYASAINSCYYRLAQLIKEETKRKELWKEVKRDYAEMYLMGRRIWRRPTHPNRLRIVYDLAVLCIRFNDLQNDETISLFRELLSDYKNCNFEVLDEVEFAESISKIVRLENHVIDIFYARRRHPNSSRSSLTSFRSFRSHYDCEPQCSSFRSRRSFNESMKPSIDSKSQCSSNILRAIEENVDHALDVPTTSAAVSRWSRFELKCVSHDFALVMPPGEEASETTLASSYNRNHFITHSKLNAINVCCDSTKLVKASVVHSVQNTVYISTRAASQWTGKAADK